MCIWCDSKHSFIKHSFIRPLIIYAKKVEFFFIFPNVVVLFFFRPQVLCNTGGLREIPTKRLPASVENLSLTKNNFPIIKSDAFAGLRNLRKLSLDGNNITVIKPFAFRGLPKIREISIQHTPLATVAQFAFAGLQNITTILLSHNKILRVETNAFAGTSNVKLILLSNNPMLKIETSAFSGLTHVEHLILPSGIRIIEPDAFYSMDSVGLLKLAFMDLTELSPFTFRGLTNVAVLSLQESDLGIICANSFDGLSHVGTLKFLNNKIDSIEELNLTSSHHIKHLIFHGNHLLETPDLGAIILEGIRNISVINNHFPCGCHVHTLLDSPLSNGSYQRGDFLSRNYCISPLEVVSYRQCHIFICFCAEKYEFLFINRVFLFHLWFRMAKRWVNWICMQSDGVKSKWHVKILNPVRIRCILPNNISIEFMRMQWPWCCWCW